jgi:hypothetical protein
MSLVYAKKSDEIGCVFCVLRMFLHATVACGTELLDVLGIKNHVAMFCTRVYLLT